MSARLLRNEAVSPFDFPSLHEVPPAPHAEPALAAFDSAAETAVALAEAQAEAERTRGYAEGLQQGTQDGHRQGYEAGFAEGAKAAEAGVVDLAHRLAALVDRLGAPLPELDRRVEEAVAALALEVARCVIGDEVNRSHAFLVGLIREAIAKVPVEMGAPRVVLNPADLELVRQLAPEIETASAMLVADELIEVGGCIVVADGDDKPIKDRRWNARAPEGVSEVDLTLPSRWRAVLLSLFDGEDE